MDSRILTPSIRVFTEIIDCGDESGPRTIASGNHTIYPYAHIHIDTNIYFARSYIHIHRHENSDAYIDRIYIHIVTCIHNFVSKHTHTHTHTGIQSHNEE